MARTEVGPGPLPKPNSLEGVSVSGAEECAGCFLKLGTNVSTSIVTLTRSVTADQAEEAPSPCDADGSIERPGRKTQKNVPGEIACEKDGITTYHRSVPRDEIAAQTHCDPGWDEWSREGLEGGSVRVRCFGPCPFGQRPNRGPGEGWRCEDSGESTWWDGGLQSGNRQREHRPQYNLVLNPVASVAREVKWASDKKMFIKPDKPFELSFNGRSFLVNEMSIYRPCPIRVENIQADAVLSLNDFSTPGVTDVILIPISAGVSYGPAGDFIGRVMQNVNAFVINEATNQYAPIEMPTGNDWSLTRLLPTGSDNGIVASAYFQWFASGSGEYERVILDESDNHVRYAWKQKDSINVIMVKEPALVSYLTSTYIAMLPYAPSTESAPAPPDRYVFKKGACISCGNKPRVDPAKLEEIQEEQKKMLLQPSTLAELVGWAVVTFAAAIGLYFGLKWALSTSAAKWLASGVSSVMDWIISPRKKTPVAGAPAPAPAPAP